MSAIIRRYTWLIGAIVIVAIAAASFFYAGHGKRTTIDPARQAREDMQRARAIKLGNWRYKEVCPSGHETEIVMGKMRLHVDMRLVAFLELEDFQEVPDGCPSGPIFAQSMSFDHIFGTKEYHAMIESRGLPLNHLDIDVIGPRGYAWLDIRENPEARIVVDGLGTIDDVSRKGRLPDPHSKLYRLQHASVPSPAFPAVIMMTCGGDIQENKWRYCETHYTVGDVRIDYEFRQDTDFPYALRDEKPVKEPEEFLALDGRVREWVEEMLRPPAVVQ